MTLDQWCCNVKWVRDFLHIYLFVTSTTLPRTNTGSVLNARAKIWRDWVRFGWEWGCSGGKIIINCVFKTTFLNIIFNMLFCMLLSYLGRSSLIIRKKKCQWPLSTQLSRFIFRLFPTQKTQKLMEEDICEKSHFRGGVIPFFVCKLKNRKIA